MLAGGTAAQASFSALGIGLPVLAPVLRDEYGLSLAQVGVVLAAGGIGLVVALVPCGVAVDRFVERWAVAGGLAAAAATIAAAAFAESALALVALLALAGAAGAAVQSGSGIAVMRWFAADERGLAFGVRQTAVPLGGVLAALALPAIGSAHHGLLFLAALLLGGALAAALTLRERPVGGTTPSVRAPAAQLRDGRLVRLLAASGLYVVAQLALMGFLVLFLVDARGFSNGEAGAALAAMQAAAVVLRIAAGRWSDVLGSRIVPLRRLGLSTVVSLALATVLVDAASALVVVAFVTAGALSMAWNGLSYAAAAELAGPGRSGAAIGVQQTVLASAGVVVPVAFATAVSATSWQAAYGIAALFPLAGWWALRGVAE